MSATTTTVVNGVLPLVQDAVEEIAEFEKILKLRDEIFAGNHPRLTVPTHALRKVSPASTQLSSDSSAPVQAQQSSQLQPPGLSLSEESERPKSTQPQPVTTPSGINPVLLTKSDDLIRAETALQRRRLEGQLRDQFEQKRLDFRKKPAPAEAKPDFNVVALLAKALEVVKPVSVSKEQSDKEEENDSVDENSFYSSRAPDSTPDRGDRSSSEEGIEEQVPAVHADPTTTTKPPSGPRRPASRSGVHPTTASRSAPAVHPIRKNGANSMDVDDDDEEGEYSPPEPEQYPAQNGTSSHAALDPRSRQMRRYSDLDQNGKRPASPTEPNMRIVRNHITSPIAPQPSRVSPLALTKDSLVSQGRQHQNGRQRGRVDSPSQSPEPVSVRNKRRKIERKADKRGRRGIKQENISPPPFHDIQPLGVGKQTETDNRPIIIDEPPPQQEIRYAPAPRYIDSPQRPISRQAEAIPISEPRVQSRVTVRPRDDQDLRRVASMHNMRVEQPREYVEYAAPARQRAMSYMRVDSPMREIGGYGSENDPPLQEIRVVRTPAPEYRDMYPLEPEVRYIPEPMPPPPRERIVVDQYGRRFREIVQERAPATPPRAPSYLPQEPPRYYENYTTNRSASVMVEEQPQPRYEEMPPPRVMRQVAEQSGEQPIPPSREVYEPLSGARSASAAVFERPTQPARQMVYADHPNEFGPPPRIATVRPPLSQYDEQPAMQIMPRAASVRPGRDASIFVDDRASTRREYLPVEQPRYRVVEPDPQMQQRPRYVDAQGREIHPHPPQDSGVRYVQRY